MRSADSDQKASGPVTEIFGPPQTQTPRTSRRSCEACKMISREATGPVSAATDNEAQNSDQLGGPVGFLATSPGRALQGLSASGQDDMAARPDRMRRPRTEARPIELLRDERGVYGIGVSNSYDHEAHAWACGIEEPTHNDRCPASLILRPDKLVKLTDARFYRTRAVLQKITGGFRYSLFSTSTEEGLRQFIHHEALRRAGLPWPPKHYGHSDIWWSTNKRDQTRNRAVYHGLRLLSLHVVNQLIGKAIEDAADADAIKAARRFAFAHRENIYRATTPNRRALQLTETFPLLALVIYSRERSILLATRSMLQSTGLRP